MRAKIEERPMSYREGFIELTQAEYDAILAVYLSEPMPPGWSPVDERSEVNFITIDGNVGSQRLRVRVVPGTSEWPRSCDLVHAESTGCQDPTHFAPGTRIPEAD